MIFCHKNPQFCKFDQFSIKNDQNGDFLGLKLLKIMKISNIILSLKVPKIDHPVALCKTKNSIMCIGAQGSTSRGDVQKFPGKAHTVFKL